MRKKGKVKNSICVGDLVEVLPTAVPKNEKRAVIIEDWVDETNYGIIVCQKNSEYGVRLKEGLPGCHDLDGLLSGDNGVYLEEEEFEVL